MRNFDVVVQLRKKELQLATYKRMAEDPRFFLWGAPGTGYNGVYTIDEEERKEDPFKLLPRHPYMEFLVDVFEKEKHILIAKSRRLYITWLFSALILHDTLFHKGRLAFISSKKEDDSHFLVNRCGFIYRRLPEFVQELVPSPKSDTDYTSTYCKLRFPTMDSFIWGIPQGAQQLRQYSASVYFADEAAFQDELEASLQAAIPMAAKVVLVSSSNPGHFENLYREGLTDVHHAAA